MTEPAHFPLWTDFGREAAAFSTSVGTAVSGCVVLAVNGDVDLMSRRQFAAALQAQPSVSARAVIVDLSGVPFCDARGAGELLRLRERAHRRHIQVHLVATPNVRRCLEVLDVARTVPTHHDLAAALAAAGCRPD